MATLIKIFSNHVLGMHLMFAGLGLILLNLFLSTEFLGWVGFALGIPMLVNLGLIGKIRQGLSKKEEDMLRNKFIPFARKVLKIEDYVQIIIQFQKHHEKSRTCGGYQHLKKPGNQHCIVVFTNPFWFRISMLRIMFVIAHELTHSRQHELGRIKINEKGQVTFRREVWNPPWYLKMSHNAKPEEKQANRGGDKVIRKWFELPRKERTC